MQITLETRVPQRHADTEEHPWPTLAEAFDRLRAELGNVQLFVDGADLTERQHEFRACVREGRSPNIGQLVAGWYYAKSEAILAEYIAEGSQMTTRSFDARRGAAIRLVFHRGY